MISEEFLHINTAVAQTFAVVLVACTIVLYFVKKMIREDKEHRSKKQN